MKFVGIVWILILSSARMEQSIREGRGLRDFSSWTLLFIAISLAAFGDIIVSSKPAQALTLLIVVLLVTFKQRKAAISLNDCIKMTITPREFVVWMLLSVAIALIGENSTIHHSQTVQIVALFFAILLIFMGRVVYIEKYRQYVIAPKNSAPLVIKLISGPFIIMTLLDSSSNMNYPLNALLVFGLVGVFIFLIWANDRLHQNNR